ncbi:MAG: Fur family transcriptional regulator [Candidatus Dormibacteria bacterium]
MIPGARPPRDALRRAGLRVTPQRLAVLEAMSDAGGEHLSADDVWQQLPPRWSMDRSTAFRVLADLTDAGLLTQVRFADGVARFEMQSHAHHHAVCTRCGSTSDIPTNLVTPIAAALARTIGFEVARDQPLLVRGTCRACAQGAGDVL